MAMKPILQLTVDENGTVTIENETEDGTETNDIKLKADETLKIQELPSGTRYNVVETAASIPTGYTKKTESGTNDSIGIGTTSTASFVNEYITTGSIDIEGTKDLKFGTLEEGKFSAALYATDDKFATTTDALPMQTKPNDASGNFIFDLIEYSGRVGDKAGDLDVDEETGLYKVTTKYYKVVELAGSDTNFAYDKSVYGIIVTLTDDGEGHIETSKTITKIVDAAGVPIAADDQVTVEDTEGVNVKFGFTNFILRVNKVDKKDKHGLDGAVIEVYKAEDVMTETDGTVAIDTTGKTAVCAVEPHKNPIELTGLEIGVFL